MNKNLADITLVVDRSGSMVGMKDDAEGGINTFIEEQKNLEGEANLTIVQFDTEYEFVCNGINIKDAPKYTLVPRGATALLDAVGRAISEARERLGNMPHKDHPGLVVFAIVTDGQENSSREFTLDKIKEMITEQETQDWQFTFLGANQDAFATGMQMGIIQGSHLTYTSDNAASVYFSLSSNVSGMRCATSKGLEVKNDYTDEQRASATS